MHLTGSTRQRLKTPEVSATMSGSLSAVGL